MIEWFKALPTPVKVSFVFIATVVLLFTALIASSGIVGMWIMISLWTVAGLIVAGAIIAVHYDWE